MDQVAKHPQLLVGDRGKPIDVLAHEKLEAGRLVHLVETDSGLQRVHPHPS